jgi:hypothetical protein
MGSVRGAAISQRAKRVTNYCLFFLSVSAFQRIPFRQRSIPRILEELRERFP